MSTETPPVGTLICRRLPENVYAITFIVPEGENSSYQQVIETPLKLGYFFYGDTPVFVLDEYRAKVINPMVPVVFVEGNILVADGVEYIIKIVQYKPSPRQELVHVEKKKLFVTTLILNLPFPNLVFKMDIHVNMKLLKILKKDLI
jgi:hypothetical protein